VGGGLGTSFLDSKIRTPNNTNWQSSSQNSFYPVFEVGGIYFVNRHLALQARAQSRAMPLELGNFSVGLVYWLKPQNFAVDNTNTPSTLAKGNWLIGGSLGGESNSDNSDQNENKFQISARFGKFVRDRTIVGLELSYESRSGRFRFSDNRSRNYALGVFLKRYWLPNRLTPFSSYGLEFQRNTNGETAFVNQYEANVNLGLAYLISPRFILEANLLRFNQRYTTYPNSDYAQYDGSIRGSLSNGFTLQYVFK